MKVLQVAAEAYPLVKTGGLGDVMGALPPALAALGVDVRLLLPGLPEVIDGVVDPQPPASIGRAFGADAWLVAARLPHSGLPVIVVDAPALYRRRGTPYGTPDGQDWPDNLQRFALLGWAASCVATDGQGLPGTGWRPDIVHAHDWHAALACTFIELNGTGAAHAHRPGTIFSIHNLAYQGLFPGSLFPRLHLPPGWFKSTGLEFYGQVSFMKGGLVHADRLTTVSPRYAREVQTPAFGCGLDGVLRQRSGDLTGILNGIDTVVWDPAADASIAARYDAARLDGKAVCKAALQAEFGLPVRADAPLFAVVSRMVHQKGLDLLLHALPALRATGSQLVVQGSGDRALEAAFRRAAGDHAGQVAVHIGYDEPRAHRMVAGADAIVVPSRFEPCGLTQMYGLRYGTPPVVRRVGGLADTVTDADAAALDADQATGFCFDDATPEALAGALLRAVALHHDQPPAWHRVVRRAMAQDHGWAAAAAAYCDLYRSLLPAAGRGPGARDTPEPRRSPS